MHSSAEQNTQAMGDNYNRLLYSEVSKIPVSYL